MGIYIDFEGAIEELGLDKEDFIEFSQDLKEFVEESLPQLTTSIQDMDYPSIREHAHSIKGAMANLRFIKVADIAYSLEKIGSSGEGGEQAPGLLEEMKIAIDKSFEEVGTL